MCEWRCDGRWKMRICVKECISVLFFFKLEKSNITFDNGKSSTMYRPKMEKTPRITHFTRVSTRIFPNRFCFLPENITQSSFWYKYKMLDSVRVHGHHGGVSLLPVPNPHSNVSNATANASASPKMFLYSTGILLWSILISEFLRFSAFALPFRKSRKKK